MKIQIAMSLLVLVSAQVSFAVNTTPVHLNCLINDVWNERAEVTVIGNQVTVIFSDKIDPPATESGYLTSAGEFNLNQGEIGCGSGVDLNIDTGLLNGGMTVGSATLSFQGNYGCEGETAAYSCKIQ
jgi:hypothetical protein